MNAGLASRQRHSDQPYHKRRSLGIDRVGWWLLLPLPFSRCSGNLTTAPGMSPYGLTGTKPLRPRYHGMQDDNLIRRNRELLEEAQAVRDMAREVAAHAAGNRFATHHTRDRVRKMLWARALWPRFLRRIYPASAFGA